MGTPPMIVNSTSLAQELRRRRLGRRPLLDALHRSEGSTWLPCALQETPSSLLMLAAMAMAQPGSRRPAE